MFNYERVRRLQSERDALRQNGVCWKERYEAAIRVVQEYVRLAPDGGLLYGSALDGLKCMTTRLQEQHARDAREAEIGEVVKKILTGAGILKTKK